MNIVTNENTTITIIGNLTGTVTIDAPNAHVIVPVGTKVEEIEVLSVSENSLVISGTVDRIVVKMTEPIRIYGSGLSNTTISNGLDSEDIKVILSESGDDKLVIKSGKDLTIGENLEITINVKNEDELRDALKDSSIEIIKLANSITLDSIKIDRKVIIDGGGNTLTITGRSGTGNREALGLHVASDVIIKNITIEEEGTIEDNLIEVMGSNAKLELEDVEIKNFNQAGIYVGDSSTSGEMLILKGNISFTTNNQNAWGGVGVGYDARLDIDANINYTGSTVDIFANADDVEEGDKQTVAPIIWTESPNGTEVSGEDGFTPYFIYKDVDGNRIQADDDNTATQTIFTKQ